MPLGKPSAPGSMFHTLKGAYGQNKVCKERNHPGGDSWRRLIPGSCAAVLPILPVSTRVDDQGENVSQLTDCLGRAASVQGFVRICGLCGEDRGHARSARVREARRAHARVLKKRPRGRARMSAGSPMITGHAPSESQVNTMSRSKRLEPCGRCQNFTAVRVALPCGRHVSLCIPCAAVFARFLNKRIRDLARDAPSEVRPAQGQSPGNSPVCLAKDSLHSFQGFAGANIARKSTSQRLRSDRRVDPTERKVDAGAEDADLRQREESFAPRAVEKNAFSSQRSPRTPRGAGAGAGGRGGGGGRQHDTTIQPRKSSPMMTSKSWTATRRLGSRSMGSGRDDGADADGAEGMSRKNSGLGFFPEILPSMSPVSVAGARACASPLNGRASPLRETSPLGNSPKLSVKMRFGLPPERPDIVGIVDRPVFSGGGTSVASLAMVARG